MEDILHGLTPAQVEAVTHIDGPMLVLAGAGSGKTRVITRRIAYLISQGVPAWQILAITFTNKAAGEMRDRTESLVPPGSKRPMVTTFHSFSARMLREYAEVLDLDAAFTIYDTSDQTAAVKRALLQLNLDPTHFEPGRILESISRAKNKLERAADYARTPRTDVWARHLASVYELYESILRESHSLDFDDLLLEVALGLRDKPEFRERLHDRFRYILIDEYQDTNHAQYVIARDLAGPRRNLCATGDPDQSIYGWRGAELSNILDFEKDFPDAKVVRLEKNYRSTKTILAAADSLIRHNRQRKAKGLFTDNPQGDPIRVVEVDDEEAEAASIVRRIQQLRGSAANVSPQEQAFLPDRPAGLPYRQIAIFVRTGAQTRAIEDGLRRARPPIPYDIVRGTSFYERKEVRDILAYLEVLHNPNDEVNLRRIINTPARGLGDKTVDVLLAFARKEGITLFHALPHVPDMPDLPTRARTAVEKFKEMMDRLAVEPQDRMGDLVEAVIAESGYRDALSEDEKDRRENLDELVTLAANFDRDAAAHPDDEAVARGLEGFLQTVALSSDQDTYDEKADRVPLMTLHAAKGLEFPAVFIAGCEDGLLPHSRSREDRSQLEEERRLFFVGMTRAKQFLTLTHARFRRIRGRLERCVMSPFLAEIPPETIRQFDEATGTRPTALDETEFGYKAPGADRLIKKETDERSGFTVGEMVRHPTYGLGRVAQFTTMGGRRVMRIHFNTVGEKFLDPEYARLQRVARA
jgi:DNA helicase II / ATP-dependent DNA helicase PcrA